MRIPLLSIVLFTIALSLQGQKDTTSVFSENRPVSLQYSEAKSVNLSLYPVPVKENYFNISSDKDISLVKLTNIIGQDIMRIQYNNPQSTIKVNLDNPRRGMYLVTVVFSDGNRVVKKIMIEPSE